MSDRRGFSFIYVLVFAIVCVSSAIVILLAYSIVSDTPINKLVPDSVGNLIGTNSNNQNGEGFLGGFLGGLFGGNKKSSGGGGGGGGTSSGTGGNPPGDNNSTNQNNTGQNISVQCSDTADNDLDGWKDMADMGCINVGDNDEINNFTNYQCSDNLDNDGDGKKDGYDLECVNYLDNNESLEITAGGAMWQVMPIRSEDQWNKQKWGGEAEQFPRGGTRSLYNPNRIYISHDVGQAWRSDNAGDTWRQCLSKNLPVLGGVSMAVDPVNPDTVFLIASNRWNKLVRGYEGLYRSLDGCDSWTRVLAMNVSFDVPEKSHQEAITYDPASIDSSGAKVWYAATPKNGLFRSDDGGLTWTSSLGLQQSITNNVQILYPPEGKSVSSNPPRLMFDSILDNYAEFDPLFDSATGIGVGIFVNFGSEQTLSKLEIYQGNYLGNKDSAKDIEITFSDESSIIRTLANAPFTKQEIDLGGYNSSSIEISVKSIYEGLNPISTAGGFAEIRVLNNTGQNLPIWDFGIEAIFDIEAYGDMVYIATVEGLYCSSQKGVNPHRCGDIPEGTVASIETTYLEPNNVYAVLDGVGQDKGLYKSTNSGTSFSLLKQLNTSRYVFLNPSYPENIWLVPTGMAGVSKSLVSNDGGASWSNVISIADKGDKNGSLGLGLDWHGGSILGQLSGIFPNPSNPNEAVAYAKSSLFKSINGGKTFYENSTGFTGFSCGLSGSTVGFDVNDSNRFTLFCNDVGMVATSNGGDYFKHRDVPYEWITSHLITWGSMLAGDVQPIAGSQLVIGSIGRVGTGTTILSSNGGLDWSIPQHDNKPMKENVMFLAFHPDKPLVVYSGSYRSDNAGVTWTNLSRRVSGMCQSNGDIVYSSKAGTLGIYKSTNMGDTWQAVYSDPLFTASLMDQSQGFAVDSEDCNKFYVSIGKKNIIDGTISGQDLAIFDGTSLRMTGLMNLAGGQEIGNFIRSIAVDPSHSSVVYAVANGVGGNNVFRSLDGGTTWADISYNIPRSNKGAIQVSPLTGDVFLPSSGGTWLYPAPYNATGSIYERVKSRSAMFPH